MSADHGATCGCCTGLVLASPLAIENRPGLSAIVYRIGTHPHFKASLLARLATADHPALQQLTTRRDDDFAIALCDGWATVADVLTFYQERIANESYLRTATERRSIAELARLIDYALRPGVAASTPLVFTIETAEGAPAETLIPTGTKVMSVPGPGEKPQTFETVSDLVARGVWNAFRVRRAQPGQVSAGATSAWLAGVTTNLAVGDRVLFLGAGRRASASSTDWQVRTLTRVAIDRARAQTEVTWDAAVPALGAPVEVYALRQRSGLMGNSAPDPKNLADDMRTFYSSQFSSTVAGVPIDWNFPLDSPRVYLDGVFPAVTPGEQVLLENENGFSRLLNVTSARALTRNVFSLSQRATRVAVDPAGDLTQFHGANLRGTTAYFQRERLLLADQPITSPVQNDAITLEITVSDLPARRLLLIQGIDADTGAATAETMELLRVEPWGAVSRLILARNLAHRYRADTAIINGNVAPATHGETVREAVGSGDGSIPFQRMKLRQAPLTYVPASTATGSANTLALRVNDLLWREVRTLFGSGPEERVFVARQEDDGATVVQFGDGRNGARLPTGRENVTAVYRKGMGLDGLLAGRQLTQLITRPLGAKEVVNPLPATGAEAAESVSAARTNCTLTIHTLDRVVSLQDYEDFARAFGGIAKALATWFWDGKRRGVFVSVAAVGGATIDSGSDLRHNLISALRAAGDPHVPVDVRSYVQQPFGAAIALATATEFVRATLLERVRAALNQQFSFDARNLAQSVTIDAVLAAAQSVLGVVAANVTRLNHANLAGVVPRLIAQGPRVVAGDLVGAELRVLEPSFLELTELA
ncbi:MAG: putative baseplate assembly protein [Longimicrobiales bacterium]